MKTIIEMAGKAFETPGVEPAFRNGFWTVTSEELERFADLVRADEREAWEHKYARLQSLMEIRETQPNKPCCLAEREACAKVCEDQIKIFLSSEYKTGQPLSSFGERHAAASCAEAIRARGNT